MFEAEEEGIDAYGYAIRPSKAQQKRESLALEDLGVKLIGLDKSKLKDFDLPQDLLVAVLEAQTISSHAAGKRQRKFIAKLLRDMEDTQPIQAKLDRLNSQSAEAIGEQHRIERWRDRLLNGNDADINAFLSHKPDADRQKLRQLVRDANKEREAQASPRSARLLFKYLREILLKPEELD